MKLTARSRRGRRIARTEGSITARRRRLRGFGGFFFLIMRCKIKNMGQRDKIERRGGSMQGEEERNA